MGSRDRSPIRHAAIVVVLSPWLVWLLWRASGLSGPVVAIQLLAFTPYAAATSPAPVLAALLLRHRVGLVAGLAVCVGFAALMVPRVLSAHPVARYDGPVLRVMTLNTKRGGVRLASLAALVRSRHIDVLALQELPREDVPALRRAGFDRQLPHRFPRASPGKDGSILFSDRPLLQAREVGDADQASQPRVEVEVGGVTSQITLVHPPSPTNVGKAASWRRGLRSFAEERPSRSAILLGDFNATLDNPELRRLLGAGWVDGADHVGRALDVTFRRPPLPPITIDHVLTARGAEVVGLDVVELPGSDHRAVVATVRLRR